MPGLFRCTCGDYARVLHFTFAREAMGALGTRHSLRPLIFWANGLAKPRAPRAAGSRRYVLNFEPRHCEERSDANRHCERSEAIHSQSDGDNGLLRRFAPRNDVAQDWLFEN
jgi:hypothetical protein